MSSELILKAESPVTERIALYFKKTSKICFLSFSPSKSIVEMTVKGLAFEAETLIDFSWCDQDKIVLLMKDKKGMPSLSLRSLIFRSHVETHFTLGS